MSKKIGTGTKVFQIYDLFEYAEKSKLKIKIQQLMKQCCTG